MDQSYTKGEIVIYANSGGLPKIKVKLQAETVWLTQKQMATLFDKGIPAINEHIRNIFREGELNSTATIRKFRIVQKEGKRLIERDVDHYNLDVIISVGYRVHSQRGTQFRIWANKVIKNYLIKGYSINEKRLKQQTGKLDDLKKTVKLLTNVIEQRQLDSTEATGLLKIISDYTYALDILDAYDHQRLKVTGTTKKKAARITYVEARQAIDELAQSFSTKGESIGLFGKEKDQSFKGSLNAIHQTFGGNELYTTIEEKAAHLLYFVIKNHSFVDGNKRIAAFLFVWFLQKNNYLYQTNGQKRIADNALVALCLMSAASKASEKDIIIKVIVNLINTNN